MDYQNKLEELILQASLADNAVTSFIEQLQYIAKYRAIDKYPVSYKRGIATWEFQFLVIHINYDDLLITKSSLEIFYSEKNRSKVKQDNIKQVVRMLQNGCDVTGYLKVGLWRVFEWDIDINDLITGNYSLEINI